MGDGRTGKTAGRDGDARYARTKGRGSGRPLRVWKAEDVDSLRAVADRAIRSTIAGGASAYDRARLLPRLIALDPRELAPNDAPAGARIMARLRKALRAERARGRAGHWTYDLNRHLALAQALAAEEALSGSRTAQRKAPPGDPDGASKMPELKA